tara:strand:- start:51 stop:734 length:684 start_codon:yes stop_codon:yes gene_type:complete
MLALKLGLSLVSTPILGSGWSPDDEASLVAWYQNQVGITLNGSDVSAWEDSATAGLYDMVQATATEQPAYSAGVLTFVSADKNNLQTTGQISLAGDFTFGLRIRPAIAVAGTFLGDNTSGGELFKYANATTISIKIGGGATNISVDSGTFGDDYLVITRASDVLTLWQNGVVQTSGTPTLAGTSLVDVMGIRKTDVNGFDGAISEIQIYNSSNATLTGEINTRLASL